jgi:alpha-N-arabinofuranosidase
VVAFRSQNIYGPYESYNGNPILTQRHLQGNRLHPITSTGHADFVQLPDGRWYTVFLGTRPYQEDYFNTGRETFLTPVEWKEGWPMVNPGEEEVKYQYPLPLTSDGKKRVAYSGNFSYRDNFDGKHLVKDWMFLRTIKTRWYDIKNGSLHLKLRPETVAGKLNPSYIGRRQQHTNFVATTDVRFKARIAKEKAGLLCFINEDHFYFLAISTSNGHPVVQLLQSSLNKADTNDMVLLAEREMQHKPHILLRAEAEGSNYRFSYSVDGVNWTVVKDKIDGRFLSTKVAGGFGANFVGCTIGPYATSLGTTSTNTAAFDWFSYKGKDEVFK